MLLKYLSHLLIPATPHPQVLQRLGAILYFEPSAFTCCLPLTSLHKKSSPKDCRLQPEENGLARSSQAPIKHCQYLPRVKQDVIDLWSCLSCRLNTWRVTAAITLGYPLKVWNWTHNAHWKMQFKSPQPFVHSVSTGCKTENFPLNLCKNMCELSCKSASYASPLCHIVTFLYRKLPLCTIIPEKSRLLHAWFGANSLSLEITVSPIIKGLGF